MQIGFLQKLCTGCKKCVGSCENGALVEVANAYRIKQENCTACNACVEKCYYGALVSYGKTMTSGEVFEQVRRDKMFYDSSGGGVTVSGGEPLARSQFVYELFESCRAEGINTCVETCGYVSWKAFELVLPVTDHFYFDLKIMDADTHRLYTGADNAVILENATKLAATGADILFRQPLIGGVNDGLKSIMAVSQFIHSLNREDISLQLMPYHRLGQSKYEALGKSYNMDARAMLEPGDVENIRLKYVSCGISCTVSH